MWLEFRKLMMIHLRNHDTALCYINWLYKLKLLVFVLVILAFNLLGIQSIQKFAVLHIINRFILCIRTFYLILEWFTGQCKRALKKDTISEEKLCKTLKKGNFYSFKTLQQKSGSSRSVRSQISSCPVQRLPENNNNTFLYLTFLLKFSVKIHLTEPN